MRIAAIVVVLGVGTAHAQAIVIPPLEFDLGASTASNTNVVTPELLLGLHWASLAWIPSRMDVGVGWVAADRVVDTTAKRARMADAPAFAMHGAYASIGYALWDRRHLRVWVSARGEVIHANLAGKSMAITGGALRIAAELYQWDAWAKATSCGAGVRSGSIALGVYVEVSHRTLPSEFGPDGSTMGLTLRLPFLAAGGGGGGS